MKRFTKRSLSALLITVMTLSSFAACTQQEEPGDTTATTVATPSIRWRDNFLNSLKILGDFLQLSGNRLIFAPFKHQEGVRSRPTKAAIIMPPHFKEIKYMQHRVGQWITPPRYSLLRPEQRVVLHIFIV